ncbi:hypothetical protein AWJ20_1393 [Sugiyamaella lignohabitans]|uniref:CoA-transferase family III n=1 Tax=Sugiyamaella lignohabitans TaxID=796027 RepID=A0A167DNQ3_9ASCO|nr:uncharacterized protein AWJ20_1393 [Sugiyamaella lignohabitans]ANB13112.1 hypothetical protein AWJ20_1393 [Sugiyamaella lignohabitans]
MSSNYSAISTTQSIFESIVGNTDNSLPSDARSLADKVHFSTGFADNSESDLLVLPCPFKECEVISALKGVEGSVANAIGKLRYGFEQTVDIEMYHASLFLLMAYVASVNGHNKLDKGVKKYLKDTDLLAAQSDLYRRMSANLYRTKDSRYYHIHGSLEASTTLKMIGLPSHSDLSDYDEIVDYIGTAVSKFTAAELEELNRQYRQAGTTALTQEQFLATPHGKEIASLPPWEVTTLETTSPKVPFSEPAGISGKPQILEGFKVVEMCRIIAGPTIGRILAEYGAKVIKVTSPNLSDVPFFQVDGNTGKHTTDIDIKTADGRQQFEALIADADIILDGYRTNALKKLGYGPDDFAKRGRDRGKGYIYVSENCFGFKGEWSYRPGWQQIADCVSGLAWAQGRALGREEPIIPPFPMSDYGTGCIGAIAALDAVYKRATVGGSYWANTSLVQYDLLLMAQGQYPNEIWQTIKDKNKDMQAIRYYDSVDAISSTALKALLNGKILDRLSSYLTKFDSPGFNGEVKVLSPVVKMDKTRNGFNETSRPNGYDKPVWW